MVTLWWERQPFLNKSKLLILIYHSSIFYISSCRLICTSAYAEIAEIMFTRTVPLKPNENQLRKNIKKKPNSHSLVPLHHCRSSSLADPRGLSCKRTGGQGQLPLCLTSRRGASLDMCQSPGQSISLSVIQQEWSN